MSWDDLREVNTNLQNLDANVISRRELLACLVAVFCFRDIVRGKLVKLFTDNSNARTWLQKSRSSNKVGTHYLMALELIKYTVECKISATWLPSAANSSADDLSRNKTPNWLERCGRRRSIDVKLLALLISDPISCWRQRILSCNDL